MNYESYNLGIINIIVFTTHVPVFLASRHNFRDIELKFFIFFHYFHTANYPPNLKLWFEK